MRGAMDDQHAMSGRGRLPLCGANTPLGRSLSVWAGRAPTTLGSARASSRQLDAFGASEPQPASERSRLRALGELDGVVPVDALQAAVNSRTPDSRSCTRRSPMCLTAP
jgi:hypothetical protein